MKFKYVYITSIMHSIKGISYTLSCRACLIPFLKTFFAVQLQVIKA